MVVETEYPVESLTADAAASSRTTAIGRCASACPRPRRTSRRPTATWPRPPPRAWLHPLMLAGEGLAAPEELERALATRAYKGYKVFLNW